MNAVGRDGRIVLGGLGIALIVVLGTPLHYLLNLGRGLEPGSGLALVPALVILTIVLLYHWQGRREDDREHAAAQAGAVRAEWRATELERLVVFGQALGRSLDIETVRDVVLQQLPKLAGSDDGWVMIREEGRWKSFVAGGHDTRTETQEAREEIADRMLGIERSHVPSAPITIGGYWCMPLMAGGFVIGVLSVPESTGPSSEGQQRVVAATAALLGIAIRNAQLSAEVRDQSLRDGLTGCFNRIHAMDVIDMELRRARRSQMPVSLIMFDLDHFKEINDRHGYLCGDAVLAAVGACMREVLRGSDLKCRYGGEEFLVLLPETPLEGAKRVAETLRRELADIAVRSKDQTVHITASLGVSVAWPSEISPEALIGRADAALYRAKEQGRNCVRLCIETAVA